MAKQEKQQKVKKLTKQQQIDELKSEVSYFKSVIKKIEKKIKMGLMTQVKRSDRDPKLVVENVGPKLIDFCKEAVEKY